MPRDKEKQRAYFAAYYAKNREKILAKDKEYRLAHGDEIEARRRQKLRTDPEARRKANVRSNRHRRRHLPRRRKMERAASKRYRDSLKDLDAQAAAKAKADAEALKRKQEAELGYSGPLKPGHI